MEVYQAILCMGDALVSYGALAHPPWVLLAPLDVVDDVCGGHCDGVGSNDDDGSKELELSWL